MHTPTHENALSVGKYQHIFVMCLEVVSCFVIVTQSIGKTESIICWFPDGPLYSNSC